MKRFLVFAGQNYYPQGGWDDFHGSYDTLEEAEEAACNAVSHALHGWQAEDWSHIVDTEIGKIARSAHTDKGK